jgi:hypothetical protein
MGIYEFMPSNELLALIGEVLCNEQAITVDMCGNVLFLIAGFDSGRLNKVNVKFQYTLKNLQMQLADREMI